MWRVVVLVLLVSISSGVQAAGRVVTLAPHLAELVCAVGRCDRLVGVVAYTKLPQHASPRVAPTLIGDAYNINLEQVFGLQPDLVLAWEGGTPRAAVERLRGLGLRVEWVQVTHLAQVADALEQIGRLLDAEAEARRAASAYRTRLQQLRLHYASRVRLRAFYQIETEPAFSVSGRSPISEALNVCGADNVFADLPGLASIVGLEAVLAAKPQVVVYSQQEDPAAIDRYWSRLSALPPADPAFRVVVDANLLTRQSPRVLDGIQTLCEGLDRVRKQLEPISSAAR